jgi:hypothetical protein
MPPKWSTIIGPAYFGLPPAMLAVEAGCDLVGIDRAEVEREARCILGCCNQLAGANDEFL